MLLRISKKMSKRVNKSKGEQEAGNGIKVPGRELVGLMESFTTAALLQLGQLQHTTVGRIGT